MIGQSYLLTTLLREEFAGKAKKWVKKAADQGHKETADLLKNL